MTNRRLIRYESAQGLAKGVAHRLVQAIVKVQAEQERIDLCLTGGRIANAVYAALSNVPECAHIRPDQLHVWWSDDRFVPAGHPERNSLQALPLLSAAIRLDPSKTHVMPTADGKADPDEAAYSYAQDLADVVFDISLLGMGLDGHVASLFPNHPSFNPTTTALAVGVTDAPKPPPDRISVTLPVINRSKRVWFLVSGSEKAATVEKVFRDDDSLPATWVAGTLETSWMVDHDASAGLPRYNCSL
ncbi:6-phosphogluconolactonase [Cutibacterium sp.]|uniref:6-phosphogluconolactonase n=1 Tax=Cutibacterium sp. TaxID=1912221 RepID=UPI0026DA8373|nr:6-phosphogluconolactonase [Cutibacterium sp.]MDO4413029.1 6-phosphogluconolactonase [Cutibacterium sp.]